MNKKQIEHIRTRIQRSKKVYGIIYWVNEPGSEMPSTIQKIGADLVLLHKRQKVGCKN